MRGLGNDPPPDPEDVARRKKQGEEQAELEAGLRRLYPSASRELAAHDMVETNTYKELYPASGVQGDGGPNDDTPPDGGAA
jgi:hypothetical protein